MQDAQRYSSLFGRDERTPDSFWISLRYFNVYRMAVAALFFNYLGYRSRVFDLFIYASLGITLASGLDYIWHAARITESS